MQLNPMHLKVAALLGGRLFRIPEYQRAYAWGNRQRIDLFNDILDVRRSGREHFMATVVALARESRSIGADEFRSVELVDGQQRVTTLIILLKAIEKALTTDSTSDAKVKQEIGDLLVKGDDHSLILLQTNHDSSNIFANYVRTGEIDKKSAVTAADINLTDAAQECELFVSQWSRDKPLIELVATIRNRLSVIYHELADEATVYRVFEVLNSRGLDVKWIDKLKSQLMALIFEHVEDGTRSEALREMQAAWQSIYRTLGLRADLGDEALRFAGTWARSSQPNRISNQEDAAAELTKIAGTKVKSIASAGERLRAVVQAVHKLDGNIRLRAVTRIVHARFVATAILLREFEPEIEAELLGKWERVTFRIFGLGGADTRHKVGDYVRLGYDIFAGKIEPKEIILETSKLGDKYDIETVLKNIDWFECYEGWAEELRYLLFRYEEHLSMMGGGILNVSQWNRIWIEEPAKSIEHIQPRSSNEHYVNHIGNLIMLEPGVNSSLNKNPPIDKANNYKTSGLKIAIAAAELIEGSKLWDEKAVLSRGAKIEDFVRKEWAD